MEISMERTTELHCLKDMLFTNMMYQNVAPPSS